MTAAEKAEFGRLLARPGVAGCIQYLGFVSGEQKHRLNLKQVRFAFFSGGLFTFKVEIAPEPSVQKEIGLIFKWSGDWKLTRIIATGQRGLVGPPDGPTWDSVQMQVVYTHPDFREAAFDIHTSWVTPDNFPGYVDQEVQFRFDNGVWLAHQRKRGVEITVEGRMPGELKYTPNHHYNGTFVEPWGERSQRGYGVEVLRRFFEEVAHVEFGGPADQRPTRLERMRALAYNDVTADCTGLNTGHLIFLIDPENTIHSPHIDRNDGALFVGMTAECVGDIGSTAVGNQCGTVRFCGFD